MNPASPSCARWTSQVPFIGRDAVAAEKGKKLTKRLVQFALSDPQPLLYHNEPIFMNGRNVGYVTSAGYSFTEKCAIGMGYVKHPEGVDQALIDGVEVRDRGRRQDGAGPGELETVLRSEGRAAEDVTLSTASRPSIARAGTAMRSIHAMRARTGPGSRRCAAGGMQLRRFTCLPPAARVAPEKPLRAGLGSAYPWEASSRSRLRMAAGSRPI